METDLTGDNVRCEVCGRFCRECGSSLWKTAYKCENCNLKYFDRNEFNPKFTFYGYKLR